MRALLFRPIVVGLAFCCILAVPSVAAAAYFLYWDSGGGADNNWSTDANWTDNREPTGADAALIRNGGTARITLAGEICEALYVGDGSLNSGAVDMVSGSLTTYMADVGAWGGTGTFRQSGGDFISQTLSINDHGSAYGSIGSCELSGGVLTTNHLHVYGGASSEGFTYTGGTLNAPWITVEDFGKMGVEKDWIYDGNLYIESSSRLDTGAHYLVIQSPVAGQARCTIDGASSRLLTNQMDLGWYENHSGELRQYNGTVTVNTLLALGSRALAYGKYSLTDGSLHCDDLDVGYKGTGDFAQYGGTVNVADDLRIGAYSGAAGSYSFQGGTINVLDLSVTRGAFDWTAGTLNAGSVNIGGDAAQPGKMTVEFANWIYGGALNVNAGGTLDMKSNTLTIQAAGDGNTAIIDGGTVKAGRLEIGWSDNRTGKYIQNSGSTTVSGPLYAGYHDDANGFIWIDDGSFQAQNEYIGYYGLGWFRHFKGSHQCTNITLGWEDGSSGNFILYDDVVLTADYLCAGDEGWGGFTQYGTVNVGQLYIGLYSTSGGYYRLTAGTLTAGEIHIGRYGGDGNLFLTEGTISGSPIYVYPTGKIYLDKISTLTTNTWTCSTPLHIAGGTLAADPSNPPPGGAYVNINNTACDMTDGAVSLMKLSIGNGTGGAFIQHAGAVTLGDMLAVGDASGNGSYEMFGGTISAPRMRVGVGGTGAFVHNGGNCNIGQNVFLGAQPGQSGEYRLAGVFAELNTPELVVGNNGSGVFRQTGGRCEVGNLLRIGRNAPSSGRYVISGGLLDAGTMKVGQPGQGQGVFEVYGNAPTILLDNFELYDSGKLVSHLTPGGLSVIDVGSSAMLNGDWQVLADEGVGYGRYDVMRTGWYSEGFTSVELPSADWSWGFDGNTLYLLHVPEPSTLVLLSMCFAALPAIALRRRR